MSEKQPSVDDTALVSVIMPTRNSARTIQSSLESINNQSYPNIETVVVDALSKDETPRIAANLGARVISFDSERARAKNEGILYSRGEFLFFIDSDMTLGKDVVKQCVEACKRDQNTAGVVIPERSIGKSFWVKVRDFERSLYAGSKIESPRFFKRGPVVAVGGFDEEFVFFEESTLPQRIENLGLNVSSRISSNILHDENTFELSKWLAKKKYYAATARKYQERYPVYAKAQLGISNRVRIFVSNCQYKKLIRNPHLTTGLVLLKTLEYLYSMLGA